MLGTITQELALQLILFKTKVYLQFIYEKQAKKAEKLAQRYTVYKCQSPFSNLGCIPKAYVFNQYCILSLVYYY